MTNASTAEYQGIDAVCVSTTYTVIATSFMESAVRRHLLLLIDKATGNYKSSCLTKVTANGKSNNNGLTIRSQDLKVDIQSLNKVYYTYLNYVSASDHLRYASLSDTNLAVNYEYEITLAGTSTNPWVSI